MGERIISKPSPLSITMPRHDNFPVLCPDPMTPDAGERERERERDVYIFIWLETFSNISYNNKRPEAFQ